jgi:phosphoglycerate dehydrogenase-like enzyme
VVDERALVDALEKGWIGGAGLDVYEHEPLEPESRLRRLDNVVMTPHAAALSDTFEEMGWRLSIESIIDLANGYWPMAVVNRGVKPRRGLRMKPGQESCPRPGSL